MNATTKQTYLRRYYLHRPHIDELLKHSAEFPLTIVEAGLGYGKTTAVHSAFSGYPGKVVHLRLSELDNYTPHFWEHTTAELVAAFPDIAPTLEELGFPNAAANFDAYLRTLVKKAAPEEHITIIVDDFGLIHNPEIIDFFERFILSRIETISLILVSSTKTNLGFLCPQAGGMMHLITKEDLKFTLDETKEFFAIHDIPLPEPLIEKVWQSSEGWPLYLNLIAIHYRNHNHDHVSHMNADVSLANPFFEKDWFSEYGEETKHALVLLSLLDNFSKEIIRIIAGENTEEILQTLDHNMFISFDGRTQAYSFHNLYREFLKHKSLIYSQNELGKFYEQAGDYYYDHNQFTQAILCFTRSGKHDKALRAIRNISFFCISASFADFIIEQIDAMPAPFIKENPLAIYIKALVLVNKLEIGKAENLLFLLENDLKTKGDARSKSLLGEVYALFGAISILENNDKFLDYYKNAYRLLPEGSTVFAENSMITGYSIPFFITDTRPGGLTHTKKLYLEAVPYMVHVMNGGGSGLDMVYLASAAYQTFDLGAAEKYAYQAAFDALERNQHDIYGTAHFLLASIAMIRGDYATMKKEVLTISDHINNNHLTELFDMRDTCIGWFYVTFGHNDRIPPWIISERENQNQPSMNHSLSKVIYATSLLNSKKYSELIAVSTHMEHAYMRRGFFAGQITAILFQAIGHLKTGDEKAAMQTLFKAYDMTHQNGLITGFVERAGHIRSLLEVARRSDYCTFDEKWMEVVSSKASGFTKRLASMKKTFISKANLEQAEAAVSLTQNERSVLKALSQGLTREEIADFNNVSVNTIKRTITNIYNKLGAINRADAVRLATNLGLID